MLHTVWFVMLLLKTWLTLVFCYMDWAPWKSMRKILNNIKWNEDKSKIFFADVKYKDERYESRNDFHQRSFESQW